MRELPGKLWSDEQGIDRASSERRRLRLVLFTADSSRVLLALHENDCTVACVVSPARYRPAGTPPPSRLSRDLWNLRRRFAEPSVLEALAAELFIPHVPVWSLEDPQLRRQLTELQPDLFVVVGYPEIFPDELLAIPRLGCVNVHASLLPRYRGPQPIAQVLLRSEPYTGVTLHVMERKVDAGDILAQDVIPILETDTVYTLAGRIFELGSRILVDVLERFATGRVERRPQDQKRASYYRRLGPDAGRIDWSQSARRVHGLLRLADWMQVYTMHGKHRLVVRAGRLEPEPEEGAGPPPPGYQPGQIVYRKGRSLIVLCGEGRVVLNDYRVAGPWLGRRRARWRLRPGTVLGAG